MVVVAIIGILGAIAYPSFVGNVCDTYRDGVVADLRVCALGMEKFYSNDFTYVNAPLDTSTASVCPNRSPVQGQAQFSLALTSATVNDYTITASKTTDNTCDGNGFTITADGTVTEL